MDNFHENVSPEFKTLWLSYVTDRLSSSKARIEYFNFINLFARDTGYDPITCTLNAARAYFEQLEKDLRDRKLTYTTVKGRHAMLHTIRQYAIEKNVVDDPINIFDNATVTNVEAMVKPETLPSLAELYALMDLVSDLPMVRLIFALIIKSGLTSSELLAIKRNDFVLTTDDFVALRIRGSSNNYRFIELPDDVAAIARDYFSSVIIADTMPAFTNTRGTALKQRDLNRLIQKYVNMGIESGVIYKSFTAADMRLVAVSAMLAGGASDVETAKYAGITTRWLHRLGTEVEVLQAGVRSVIDLQ